MSIKLRLYIIYNELKYILRRIWCVHVRQRWYRLWIRKNEFHKSLDIDAEAMLYMNRKERRKYINDLNKRRNIAHEKGVEKKHKQ